MVPATSQVSCKQALKVICASSVSDGSSTRRRKCAMARFNCSSVRCAPPKVAWPRTESDDGGVTACKVSMASAARPDAAAPSPITAGPRSQRPHCWIKSGYLRPHGKAPSPHPGCPRVSVPQLGATTRGLSLGRSSDCPRSWSISLARIKRILAILIVDPTKCNSNMRPSKPLWRNW
jgi:hypothetical protein